MKKRTVMLLFIALAILLSTPVAFHISSQGNQAARQEEATLIKRGVMTEKQKEHGKIFKDYKGLGKRIPDILSNSGEKEITIQALPGMPELAPSGRGNGRQVSTKILVDQADAIVVGVVNGKASQFTENETFVFTDYNITIEDVLKNNTALRPGKQIEVTRPGGKILLNNQIVTALDRSIKPLLVGNHYLLFLKHVPSTGSYTSSSIYGSFQIENNKVIALTDDPLLPKEMESGRDASAFLNAIRQAVAGNTPN